MSDGPLCLVVLVVSAFISFFIAREMDEDRVFFWFTLTFLLTMAIFTLLSGSSEYLYLLRQAILGKG